LSFERGEIGGELEAQIERQILLEVNEKSHLIPPTPASILINEYHSLRLLAELGYQMGSVKELDDFTATVHIKISNEYIKAQDKKLKAGSKKRPKGK